MNLAIIPARGGSKRIPGKNTRLFSGKPVISYSIDVAISSGLFDKVIVTTDSDEIAGIASMYGAEVPFARPEELSDDYTATAPVIKHAIEWYQDRGVNIDYACCIYATAPFIRKTFLEQGYRIIREYRCASCYSVASFPFPIFRASKISDDGSLKMFWPEHEMTRSQDLPEAYYDAGQFYWIDAGKFLHDPRLYADDSRPVFLPRHLVQDIDTLEDWVRAEYMYKAIKLSVNDFQDEE